MNINKYIHLLLTIMHTTSPPSLFIVLQEEAYQRVFNTFFITLNHRVIDCNLLHQAQTLLILHREAQDFAHGLQHLCLDRGRALGVDEVDEEPVYDATVDHELQSFTVVLNFFN